MRGERRGGMVCGVGGLGGSVERCGGWSGGRGGGCGRTW